MRNTSRLSASLASVIPLVTLFATMGHGQQPNAPEQSFSVVSIKRSESLIPGSSRVAPGGRYTLVNLPIIVLVTAAYGVPTDRVIGGPAWLHQERYDIDARVEGVDNLSAEQRSRMQQRLLRERFNFRGRVERRPWPVYALVEVQSASARAKLKPTTVDCSDPASVERLRAKMPKDIPLCAVQFTTRDAIERMAGTGVTMDRLARALSSEAGRPVINRTQLTGGFDLVLEWSPATQASADHVSVFTALQEQLGLRLESTEAPLDVLVVDGIERPTAN